MTMEEVSRIINFCITSDEDRWSKSVKKVNPQLITYDDGNKQFKRLLENYSK